MFIPETNNLRRHRISNFGLAGCKQNQYQRILLPAASKCNGPNADKEEGKIFSIFFFF